MPTKRCYACGRTLSLDCFNKNRAKKDGLATECRACKKISDAKSHQKNLATRKRYASTAGKKNYARYYATPKGYLTVVYHNILKRCNNPKVRSYNRYGGRGIKCLFESLDDFRGYVLDILRVNPVGLTIDRIDNNGNYEKGNIRFVTMKENLNNKG